jgi:ElaB/YqjD/DUF883 family membrane-anchored ribosome-binding protein
MTTSSEVTPKDGKTIAKAVEEVKGGASTIAEVAGERLNEVVGKAKTVLREVNNTTPAELEQKSLEYVRVHPGRAIATAAAVGLVIGFLLGRK